MDEKERIEDEKLWIQNDKDRQLANEIIDEVSEIIEEHYDIAPKCITEDDEIENPALINGNIYYNLEDSITDKIKRNKEDA